MKWSFESVLGCTLVRVLGEGFQTSDEYEPVQQDIYLEFSNGVTIGVDCGTDGETIRTAVGRPEAYSMGALGKCVIRDLTHTPPWQQIVGQRLESITPIHIDQVEVGISLMFGGRSFSFINMGDELQIRS